MSSSAYPPCSRCGGPRQKEDFHGASVVACLNCGAVTLSRGDLQRLAGVAPSPPPAAVGRTIVPDAISSLDIGKPVLTASEPPPPPRGHHPTLSPSPPPEIPREIEYFTGSTSQQVAVPNATIAPDDFATEEEEETNLFTGDMAKALEADFANPAFEETMIPPTQATFNQFDDLQHDDDPTAEQLEMEVSVPRPSSPDPEPLLPGNRSIPDTGETPGLDMAFDEPFGGEDFDPLDDDEDDFVAQYQAARRRRMVLGVVVVALLGLALGAPVLGFLGYQAFRASMNGDTDAAATEDTDAVADATTEGDTPPDAETRSEGAPPDGAATDNPDAAAAADAAPADPPVEAKPAETKPAETKPAPAETKPTSDGSGGSATPSRLVDQGWGKVGSDPSAAAALFEKALEADPSNADANYGLGYALLQNGDTGGAKVYLCKALTNANTSTQREVNGLLTNNEMSCD